MQLTMDSNAGSTSSAPTTNGGRGFLYQIRTHMLEMRIEEGVEPTIINITLHDGRVLEMKIIDLGSDLEYGLFALQFREV
ncbi:hypothetical protein QR680_006921 [Steinernema hermaphroditum]|uniref:Uncharacterized protein n=1 Tax=Steinernema hermaphroditum TaxID=289476 RepID=A0AA39LXW0_9BILA|nr:hypothetical protein QR680_006921 [Steinernema hermaphroditum]